MARKTERKLIPILKMKKYTGYQFYGLVRIKNKQSDEIFIYLVKTMLNWIDRKKGGTGSLYNVQDLTDNGEAVLQSFNNNDEAYAMNKISITYLEEGRRWAMKLEGPDTGAGDRGAVIGRSFVTYVSLEPNDRDSVKLAVKIDIYDPEGSEELAYAFRPGFMRTLFEEKDYKGIVISQGEKETILCRNVIRVDSKQDVNDLVAFYKNENNQIPLVIFPTAEDKVEISNEQLKYMLSRGLDVKLKKIDKDGEDDKSYSAAVSEFTGEHFAFCNSYIVSDEMGEQIRQKLGLKRYDNKAAIFLKPSKFGGESSIIPLLSNDGVHNAIILTDLGEEVCCYSKALSAEAKDFYFGGLKFQDELEKEEEELRVRDRTSAQGEEIQGLSAQNTLLESENTSLKERIGELERENAKLAEEKESEYSRAAGEFKKEIESKEQKIEELGRQVSEKSDENSRLKDNLETLRSSQISTDNDIIIKCCDLEQIQPYEQYDFIISSLQHMDKYCGENNRKREMLDGLLEKNKIVGLTKKWFDDVEEALEVGQRRFTDGNISQLRKLGFFIPDQKDGEGHSKVKYKDISRYTFQAASSGSDTNWKKSMLQDIIKKMSVYWDKS